MDQVDFLEEVVSSLGPDVRLRDENRRYHELFMKGPSLLSVCCYYGAMKCIDLLLAFDVDLTLGDESSRFWFHFAAAGNCVDILMRISGQFPDVSLLAQDAQGKTIVHYAAEYDSFDVLLFCYNRFPLDELDHESATGTPLLLASTRHSVRSLHFFASINIDAMAANPPDQRERDLPIDFNRSFRVTLPLTLLIRASAYELLPIMLKAGLDVNAALPHGWPALFHAIRTGSEGYVRALCHFGACVNYRCVETWTAMHIAAQERKPNMCRILWQYKANPALFSRQGMSPFLIANNFSLRDKEKVTARTIREIMIEFIAKSLLEKIVVRWETPH
jgi:ankyrin repeat protein